MSSSSQRSPDPYLAEVVPRRAVPGWVFPVIAFAAAILLFLVASLVVGGYLLLSRKPTPLTASQPPRRPVVAVPPPAVTPPLAVPPTVTPVTPPPIVTPDPPVETVTPPVEPPAPVFEAKPPVIDLLAKIDLERDVRRGKMQLVEGRLVSQRGKPDTIFLPAPSADAYDLEIELLRRTSIEGMFVGILVNQQQCMVNLDAFPDQGYRSGLDLIDGQRVNSGQNPTTVQGKVLQENVRQTLLIEVRARHVNVELDGQRLFKFTDTGAPLSVFPLFKPDVPTLFLGTWDAEYEFSKIEYRAVKK